MEYIGKTFEYYTHNGKKWTAVVENVEFHEGLGKEIYIGISPYGNTVRHTREEIHKFI